MPGFDALAGVAIGLLCARAAFAMPLFSAPRLMASSFQFVSGATADLDGDGKLDLATVNDGAGSNPGVVRVWLGNGDGTVRAVSAYSVGGAPRAVSIGDLNGDGRPDLVTANSGPGTVSVLLASGGGAYGAPVAYAVGSSPRSVAIADLDGDTHLDLVVANGSSNTISVLLGNGDGTFQPKVDFATGSGPVFAAVADLNGDGHPDVVVANQSSNTISVLLGNGDGTFQAATSFATGSQPAAVAIGDLDGDGHLDLAIAATTPSVLLGHGDGTFGPSTAVTDLPAGAITIADLNSDGHPDLVVGNDCGSLVRVVLGHGDGTFTAGEPDFPAPAGSIAVGDLDADGRPDLALVGRSGVAVAPGNGDGTFGRQDELARGGPAIAVADFDGDGKLDMAFGGDSVSIMLGHGDETFGLASTTAAGPAGDGPIAVAAGDLNGDGHPDVAVVVGSDYYGTLSVLLGNGDGTLQPRAVVGAWDYTRDVAIADVNGDGKPDLLVARVNFTYPNTYLPEVAVFLGNGDGTFSPGGSFRVAGAIPAKIAVGDLNGDGKPDLAVATGDRYGSFFCGGVTVLIGNGDGTFPTRHDYATGQLSTWVAIGDLNGDGKPDLVVANPGGLSWPPSLCSGPTQTARTFSVLLGNGDGTFGPKTDVATDRGPMAVAISDFDGDGKADVAVVCRNLEPQPVDYGCTDTFPGVCDIYHGRGDGTFDPAAGFGVYVEPRSVVVADFDHDGRPDLVVGHGWSTPAVLKNIGGVPWLGVPPPNERPAALHLECFPNPARSELTVRFSLPRPGLLRLGVYDLSGRLVAMLADGTAAPGERVVRWDRRLPAGALAPAGIYFVDLRLDGARISRRIVGLR